MKIAAALTLASLSLSAARIASAQQDRWAGDRKVTVRPSEALSFGVCAETGAFMRSAAVTGGRCYEVDGKALDVHEAVDSGAFSPDGRVFVYHARDGKEWRAVVNGKAGAAFERLYGGGFLPDGKTYAYKAQKDGLWYQVVGDAASDGYVQLYGLSTTADGKHHAWVAQKPKEDAMVFLDGKAVKDSEEASFCAFQSGGKLVYTANLTAWTIRKKPAGARAGLKAGHSLVTGGARKAVECDGFTLLEANRDGSTLVYGVRRADGKIVLTVDGKAWDPCDGVEKIRFTATGKAIAEVRRDGKAWVVLDGKFHGPFEMVLGAYPAPAGGTVACWLRTAGGNAVGILGGPKPDEGLNAGMPVFSADGKSVAYRIDAGFDKVHVVVDGKRGPEHQAMLGEPVFLRDGRIVYAARKSRESDWALVVGGREFPLQHGDEPLGSPVAGPGNKAGIYVQRTVEAGKEIWWRVVNAE